MCKLHPYIVLTVPLLFGRPTALIMIAVSRASEHNCKISYGVSRTDNGNRFVIDLSSKNQADQNVSKLLFDNLLTWIKKILYLQVEAIPVYLDLEDCLNFIDHQNFYNHFYKSKHRHMYRHQISSFFPYTFRPTTMNE